MLFFRKNRTLATNFGYVIFAPVANKKWWCITTIEDHGKCLGDIKYQTFSGLIKATNKKISSDLKLEFIYTLNKKNFINDNLLKLL